MSGLLKTSPACSFDLRRGSTAALEQHLQELADCSNEFHRGA
jgi:hypothetical protein